MEPGDVTRRGSTAWLAGVPKVEGSEAGEGPYLP